MFFDGDQTVRESDMLALIRLSGELGELSADAAARRDHALVRLADLCNADKAVFGEFVRDANAGFWKPVAKSIQFYNTPDDERRPLTKFYDENHPADPVIEHLGRLNDLIKVGRPCDFLGESVWRASPHYNIVRRPAGVIEQIYSHHRIGDVAAGVGLHRRDARPFATRELRLMEAFMRGAGQSLHIGPQPTPRHDGHHNATGVAAAALPPRLTAVLERFLRGETEKAAAQHLGVTHHTVHSYAKQLYRRLGVSSRSELLARFISGNSHAKDGAP